MFMRNLSAICVSSGTSSIANAFNQQYWVINLSVSISAAVYVPTFIGSTYLFNMLECRTVMAIGAGLMLVGAWTRSLAMLDDNYWWVVIGQLIIACAGPTLQSPISTIANNWFGDHERAKATSLMSLSSPLGSLLGFIIQAIYIAITEEKTKNLTTAEAQQIVRQETLAMLNFESAMTTFVVLFFFLAFR
jgi:predicted MFS family arabinose efflux permease